MSIKQVVYEVVPSVLVHKKLIVGLWVPVNYLLEMEFAALFQEYTSLSRIPCSVECTVACTVLKNKGIRMVFIS